MYDLKIVNLGVENAEKNLNHGMDAFMHEKRTVKLLLEDLGKRAKVVYLSTGGLGMVEIPHRVVKENGQTEKITIDKITNTQVVFKANHFSLYAVVYKAEPTKVIVENNKPKITELTFASLENKNSSQKLQIQEENKDKKSVKTNNKKSSKKAKNNNTLPKTGDTTRLPIFIIVIA